MWSLAALPGREVALATTEELVHRTAKVAIGWRTDITNDHTVPTLKGAL
jgi:head-tail adaptor